MLTRKELLRFILSTMEVLYGPSFTVAIVTANNELDVVHLDKGRDN